MSAKNYHEIKGVIHIHSSYSDGTKNIDDIARIAENVGLDFIMCSDHMTLQPLRDGHEKFVGKTAVIIGYEIEDPKDENHYLAFGLNEELQAGLAAPEYVKLVHENGGLGIIAHPDEIRNTFKQYPSFPWNAWNAENFDGLEIWNHMSAWMESLKRINFLNMAIHPRRSLRGPTDRVLLLWDKIAQKRKIAGVGSADVHAHIYRKGPLRLTIFPYKVQFKSIRTHLLLPDPFSDNIHLAKRQILDAIRNCRVFVSNYRWGDASGFQFYIDDKGIRYDIGDDPNFSKGMKILIRSPQKALLRIIKDGKPEVASTDYEFEYPIAAPGIYRVESMVNRKGWIYSNHIRVLGKQ